MAIQSIAKKQEDRNFDDTTHEVLPKSAKPPIILNDQQEATIASLLDFIQHTKGDTFTIKGYAGTGKSTSIQVLLERLAERDIKKKVVFTAPTHKAVKVLRRMANEKGIVDVGFSTIHSLLGLKIKQIGDKQILEPMKTRKNDPLREVQIVVVDECSMIGQDLFMHIMNTLKFYEVQYIFMGDPAQLPPVGESESPTFESPEHRATLTKVMRQRGENPVLGVCTDIREAFTRGDLRLPVIVPGMAADGSCGVNILTGAMFSQWMPTAFSHDEFDTNPDRFRVIAWRNDTVDRINNMIHDLRYPDCESWLASGEPITFVKPMQNSSMVELIDGVKRDEILVQTDFEAEVIECVKDVHPEFPDIQAWAVTAKIETGELYKFYALDSVGAQIRDISMKQIAAQNRAYEQAGQKDQAHWWPYYELQQAFATVRPAYCMTAHKSQGSTFENVFVDVMDIWANPNKSEALQCLYVACSRASHHLIVNATGAAA